MDHPEDPQQNDRALSAFWRDLDDALQDSAFREAYIAESLRITAIDAAVNAAVNSGDRTDFRSMSPEALADWYDRNRPPAEQRRALRAPMESMDFTEGEIEWSPRE